VKNKIYNQQAFLFIELLYLESINHKRAVCPVCINVWFTQPFFKLFITTIHAITSKRFKQKKKKKTNDELNESPVTKIFLLSG
jgi:hypothetical protein